MRIGLLLGSLVLLAAGGGFQYQEWRLAQPGGETQGWQQVSGSIATSQVLETRTPSGTLRVPDVRFEYQVGDQTLMGLATTGRVKHPDEFVARHPLGMAVGVLYDPANPSDARLVPEGFDIEPLAVGLGGAGLLGLLAAALWRPRSS